jgi:gephyrin
MRLDPRPEFHRVTIRREGDGLVASSTGGQRSSRAGSLAGANGLVALPGKTDATGPSVPKGTVLDVVLIGEIHPSI